MKKNIFKLLIITLVIGAFLGILFIIFDYWNTTTFKIFITFVIIFGFSIPGLCCSSLYEKEKMNNLAVGGMTFCLLSCLFYLFATWVDITFNYTVIKIMFSTAILSASIGHISLLLLINSTDDIVKNLKYATILLSLMLDILLLTSIIFELSITWQIYAILIILIALGSIVTPIVNKLNNNSKETNTQTLDNKDKYDKLAQLKSLLDSQAITIEEYNAEKQKILNE